MTPVVMNLTMDIWKQRQLPSIKEMEGQRWLLEVPSGDGCTWIIGSVAEDQDLEPEKCMKVEAQVGCFYIWWNGWLAGILTPAGGTLAAHPGGANEDRLIKDLERLLVEESEQLLRRSHPIETT